MKKFYCLLLLIFSFPMVAQTNEKTILLLDEETKQPIPDATVYLQRTKQTFISNAEGEVSFILKSPSNIQITHSAYSTQTIRSLTLKETKTTLYLKRSVTDLEEIIVTRQHPQKILKSLIDNSKALLTVPARLKVYTREFFKLNGDYSYYNDGLINFQITGQPGKMHTDILVEQNRSIGLISEEHLADVLGYNLNDIMENYYNFKYLNPLLENTAKNDYVFTVKAYAKNKDYYLMSITPTNESKGLLDDYTVIYDFKKKIIVEVSSVLSPSVVARNPGKTIGGKEVYKSNFKTIYSFSDTEYYLLSSKEEIGFKKESKKQKKDFEVRNYFVTSNFSKQGYSFKEEEIFKEKTLHNKKNHILSNYWEFSSLKATEEEEKIIQEIAEE